MKRAYLLVLWCLFGCVAVGPAQAVYRGAAYVGAAPVTARSSVSASAQVPGAAVSVQVDFFGVPLGGAQDVVFVLDRSGSMSGVTAGVAAQDVGASKVGAAVAGLVVSGANKAAGGPLPTKMEAAKAELIRVLWALPDGTRVNIVFFDDKLIQLSPWMLTLNDATRAQARDWIHAVSPGGSTAAVPAMQVAYSLGASRVVLLSDGLANTGGSGDALLADARREMRRGLRIDTVGLGIDQDGELLVTLANESGGLAVRR